MMEDIDWSTKLSQLLYLKEPSNDPPHPPQGFCNSLQCVFSVPLYMTNQILLPNAYKNPTFLVLAVLAVFYFTQTKFFHNALEVVKALCRPVWFGSGANVIYESWVHGCLPHRLMVCWKFGSPTKTAAKSASKACYNPSMKRKKKNVKEGALCEKAKSVFLEIPCDRQILNKLKEPTNKETVTSESMLLTSHESPFSKYSPPGTSRKTHSKQRFKGSRSSRLTKNHQCREDRHHEQISSSPVDPSVSIGDKHLRRAGSKNHSCGKKGFARSRSRSNESMSERFTQGTKKGGLCKPSAGASFRTRKLGRHQSDRSEKSGTSRRETYTARQKRQISENEFSETYPNHDLPANMEPQYLLSSRYIMIDDKKVDLQNLLKPGVERIEKTSPSVERFAQHRGSRFKRSIHIKHACSREISPNLKSWGEIDVQSLEGQVSLEKTVLSTPTLTKTLKMPTLRPPDKASKNTVQVKRRQENKTPLSTNRYLNTSKNKYVPYSSKSKMQNIVDSLILSAKTDDTSLGLRIRKTLEVEDESQLCQRDGHDSDLDRNTVPIQISACTEEMNRLFKHINGTIEGETKYGSMSSINYYPVEFTRNLGIGKGSNIINNCTDPILMASKRNKKDAYEFWTEPWVKMQASISSPPKLREPLHEILMRDIPHQISVRDIPQQTRVRDIPQETRVRDIPQETRVWDIPQETRVRDLPQETRMRDIPQETRVRDIPPEIRAPASDGTTISSQILVDSSLEDQQLNGVNNSNYKI